MGADQWVPCRAFQDAIAAITTLRSEGITQIVAVETCEDGTPPWEFGYTFPLALVFGNEALGIAPEALELCDGIITLPMLGRKESINVGNCAAVALYSALASLQSA